MANGIISLGTSKNIMGQIVWSSTSNGTEKNSSEVTCTIQAKKTSNTTEATYGTWSGSLTIGGTTRNYSIYKAIGPSTWVTLLSFTVTISHSANGSGSCYISGSVSAPSGTSQEGASVSNSATVTLDTIPRQATLSSASNFTDSTGPKITYSNPLGGAVPSLQAGISLDGTSASVIAYHNVDKTAGEATLTLSQSEIDQLYDATPASGSGNSRTVWIYLRTRIGEEYYFSPLSVLFTITDPNPRISPTLADSNSTTVALTGSNQKLVKYYSNVAITIGATARKQATLVSTRVTCGAKSLTADGTINAVESGTFVFTATDSRGNTTRQTQALPIVDYVKLTCNVGDNKPDAEGDMTLKVTGAYFNGSFGASSNSLTVYYRYKTAGGTYPNEWSTMTATPSGSTYTATAALTGLDYRQAYTFQAYAVDKLATVYSDEKTVSSVPVFDWGENDFAFNVPVYMNGSVYDRFGAMIGNGLAAYTGGGDAGIDPNTTLESLCLTSHSNAPQGLGTFYYIHTAFYNTKSATAARSQVAFPYNKAGSLYHRHYASGAWSSWGRYMTADEIYPVGSVCIRYDNTNPATLYGGTWTRIEGRVLYGCAASGTIGATGSHTTGSGSSSLPYVNVAIWRRTA